MAALPARTGSRISRSRDLGRNDHMNLKLFELHSKRQVKSKELRAHAEPFPGRKIDHRFIVRQETKEVALLWFVVFPSEPYLVIYKLYVAGRYRGKGIGSELIRRAEIMARQSGRSRILVTPKPITPYTTREELVAWYERRGFSRLNEGLMYFKDVPAKNLLA